MKAQSKRARGRGRPRARKVPKPPDRDRPAWDQAAHTLHWRDQVVKHFQKGAPEQEGILIAFQKSGWPKCLDTSLLPDCVTKSKRHLRNSVKNLNRSVSPYLHLRLEGGGARVVWEAF
jgi:hypothetical protein